MTDLKRFLLTLNKNLAILQEREAKHAGSTPPDLLNQIDDHRQAIALTEQVIAGHLSEDDWREALRPLLVDIQTRTDPEVQVSWQAGGVNLANIVNSQVSIGAIDASIHIHEAAAELPPPHTAPNLPKHFVQRPQEFEPLVSHLLSRERRTVSLTTAFQGGGGFGKTTLALAVCHDERIRDAFPDGIVWLTLGQQPNLVALLLDQIRLFERAAPSFTDINAAAGHLRQRLAEKRVLLVLDDVWDDGHARPFLQEAPGCVHLITTRSQDVVHRLQAEPVTVNEMETDEAARLLVNWLDDPPADPQPVRDFAAYLGEWPLLLELVAPELRKRVQSRGKSLAEAIADLTTRLRRKGLTYFDQTDTADRNRALSLSLDLSLESLGDRRDRYLELAIFPEDVDIPLPTLARLWAATANLDDLDSEDAVEAMASASLFTRYDPAAQTVRLHDVIHQYLIEQHPNLPTLHARFLNAYRPPSNSPQGGENLASLPLGGIEGGPSWAELRPDEPYLWEHLVYHLSEAGLTDELYATVIDLHYLTAKSHVRTAAAAEANLRTARAHFPDDTLLRTLSRHFANAAHLLSKGETLQDVRLTLYSRLHSIRGFEELCQALTVGLQAPYLLPAYPLPDLPHPHLIRTLTGHTHWVSGCAYSPDGSAILSASSDNTLKVWDARTGQERLTLTGHTDGVSGCAYSPDGSTILSASYDTTLKVWDAQTGQERLTLAGHTDGVSGCAYSLDGSTILSASYDGTLKVWDAQTGQEQLTLTGHIIGVSSCAYSPDGSTILSASNDTTLKVWDVQTGQEQLTLTGHRRMVRGCAYSPDGSTILSASNDTTLKVWDISTLLDTSTWTDQERLTLSGHTDWVRACAYSPDGGMILSASDDGTLKVWDALAGQEQLTLTGHTNRVSSCAYSPDGSTILSASRDRTLKVWDISTLLDTTSVQTGQEQLTLSGHTSWVLCCAYSPDGSTILSASNDTTLKVWDVQIGQEQLTLTGHTDGVSGCAYSPDGGMILSASYDGTLKVWDVQTGQERLTLSGHTIGVLCCAYSPDGSTILSASRDRTLKVWDISTLLDTTSVQTGQEQLTLSGHTSWVRSCTYSPDGGMILSASEDRTLKVWDARTGQEQLTLAGHTNRVLCCTYSPDGSTILSASRDRTLKVWDARTGQERLTLTGHRSWVSGCAYSPDGGTILSASGDGTLRVWHAETGCCLAILAVDGWLQDCAWSPDGTSVVAVGNGGVYFFKAVF